MSNTTTNEQTYRVPVRNRKVKVRTAEPVGYDPTKSLVYKFNQTAYDIVRLADGERDEYQIALELAGGDETLARELLPEFRAFFDRCETDGLIAWKP